MNTPFHLAFPIYNLEETKAFYCDLLGCSIGRSASNWIDFDFFGHQITAQVNEEAVCSLPFYRSENNPFPFYHFGAVLAWKEWHELADRVMASDIEFLIEPKTVFEGEVGEQKSFFIQDPNGYAIEFKSFEDPKHLFRAD